MPILGLLIPLIILHCGESCVLFKIWNIGFHTEWKGLVDPLSEYLIFKNSIPSLSQSEAAAGLFDLQSSSILLRTKHSWQWYLQLYVCKLCIRFPCKHFCSYYVRLYNLWIHHSFASVLSFQWMGRTTSSWHAWENSSGWLNCMCVLMLDVVEWNSSGFLHNLQMTLVLSIISPLTLQKPKKRHTALLRDWLRLRAFTFFFCHFSN